MNKMHNNTVCFANYSIGNDVLNMLPEVCSQYGSRAIVIGGHKSINSVRDKIEIAIEDSAVKIISYHWYGGECTYANIENLAGHALKNEAEIIIGIGGGKALDTAKGVSEKLGLPVITIPTIASTCAASTALSVVYDVNGEFESFYFMKKQAVHVFIDTEVIAAAPAEYLRAGMGDTIAKHYECTFASRNDELDHSSAMAREISRMCVWPILKYGEKALEDCERNEASYEVEQVILNNIISTGLVSMLIDEKYNGAAAHSLFYGLSILEHIEKDYLHGDVVGYGVLVQLAIDKDFDNMKKLYDFFNRIGIPTSLDDIKVENSRGALREVLKATVNGPDMEHIPYKIDEDMVFDAIQIVENLKEIQ